MNTPDSRPATNTNRHRQVEEVKSMLSGGADEAETRESSPAEQKQSILTILSLEDKQTFENFLNDLKSARQTFNNDATLISRFDNFFFPEGFSEDLSLEDFLIKNNKLFEDEMSDLRPFARLVLDPLFGLGKQDLFLKLAGYFGFEVITEIDSNIKFTLNNTDKINELISVPDFSMLQMRDGFCFTLTSPIYKYDNEVFPGRVRVMDLKPNVDYLKPPFNFKEQFIKPDNVNEHRVLLDILQKRRKFLEERSISQPPAGTVSLSGEAEESVGTIIPQTPAEGAEVDEHIPTSKVRDDINPEEDLAKLDGDQSVETLDYNKIITKIFYFISYDMDLLTRAIKHNNISDAYYAYLDLVRDLFPRLDGFLENNDLNPSIRQQIALNIEEYKKDKNYYLNLLERLFKVLKQKKVEPWFEKKLLDRKSELETELNKKSFWNLGKGELKEKISILTENLSEVKNLREQYPEIFFFIFDLGISDYSSYFANQIKQLREKIFDELGTNFNLKLTNKSDVSRLRVVLSQISKTSFYQSIKDDLSEAMTLLQGPSLLEEEISESQTLTLENLTLEQCRKLAKHPEFLVFLNNLLKIKDFPQILLDKDGKLETSDRNKENFSAILDDLSEDVLRAIFKGLSEKDYIKDWKDYLK